MKEQASSPVDEKIFSGKAVSQHKSQYGGFVSFHWNTDIRYHVKGKSLCLQFV